MQRAPSPPSTGYSIIDIRGPLLDSKSQPQQDNRPPSPLSSDTSEDAFNGSDLVDTILESLDQPLSRKSIPTYVLYDTKGLQLFDQITQLDDEYYLTGAELDILNRHSEEMVDRLQDGSVIFELGAGALRKTQVILRAIEKKKIQVTYYALDLDQRELDRSLASLGDFQYVQLHGLLGTYDQGIPWISKHFTASNIQKNFLWMGSSIGNQTRMESVLFLRKLQRMCMEPGDFFFIGFDKRNNPAKIELAYDDSYGVTREFIMNGLDHVNHIMDKKDFMNRNDFDYHSIYQEKQGRHLSHYRALKDMVITYKTSQKEYSIPVQKDELIHVEHSYKYSLDEIESILTAAEMNMVNYWLDSKDQYRLVLAENRPFIFERNLEQIHELLFPSKEVFEQEPISCYHCNEGQFETVDLIQTGESSDALNKSWPTQILPSLHEWQQLWKSWDVVTQQMLDHRTMLFERPIALRHPFIFYLGHIPAFVDIQLSRHAVDRELGSTALTEPAHFAEIFERGIDPDMDDPTQCHPHSEVPTQENEWPTVEAILAYQDKIRQRVQRIMTFWESEAFKMGSMEWINNRQRQARIVWMCFEHEAMHLETLLYMLVQSPNVLPPRGVAIPTWQMMLHHNIPSSERLLAEAPFMKLPGGTVILGHDDVESNDLLSASTKAHEFGWDNESPERQVSIASFEIQSRPVSNGEFYAFMQETQSNTLPASWIEKEGVMHVKTVFGLCPLSYALNWPVQVSYQLADAYAKHKNARLPTEAEYTHFRTSVTADEWANIGFKNWSPIPMNNNTTHVLGDVWEWTSTLFDAHEGYEASKIYPGYSADFFDGKHHVVVGGSWATHPRIAERKSFKNWYQTGYPYVFSGFRLCY